MNKFFLLLILLLNFVGQSSAQQDFIDEYINDYKLNYSIKSKDWKKDSLIKYYDTAWKSSNKERAAYLIIAFIKDGIITSSEYDMRSNQLLRKFYFTNKELKKPISNATVLHPLHHTKSTVNFKNGMKNGWMKIYQANGELSDSLYFENDIVINKGTLTYPNGQSKLQLHLDDQGAGTFTAYHPNGAIYYTGTYSSQNSKDGKWQYMDDKGVDLMEIIYKNDRNTKIQCYDEQGKPMKECITFKLPQYPGGVARLSQFISENFQNHNRRKRGKIVVRFLIDKEGQIDYENLEYLETIGEEYHDAVKFMFSIMPKWQPAISNNRPVDCYYTLPLSIKDDARFYHME